MARGGPKKADRGGQGKKATVTLLTGLKDDEVEIPPMPPAEDFIGVPTLQTNKRGNNDRGTMEAAGIDPDEDYFDEDEMQPEWNPAVVRWWHDIWSSPMAREFVDSDIHGLYMGCVFMHESLNPFYKLGDRNAAFSRFQAIQKDYGLTPSARESLRWQVAQGTAAQKRTDQIRGAVSAGARQESKSSMADMYKRHG